MAWIPPSFLLNVVFTVSPATTFSFVSTSWPSSLSTYWLIFYCISCHFVHWWLINFDTPVWSIFSRDTALGLVDALLSLDVLLLLFWRRSHWLRSFLQCFIECSFHNWGTWFHECLGYSWTCPVPGEGSYFSIILVILLPVPNDPVVVDSDVLSLILNSGLDSFCVSGLILCTVSIEAAEVSWSSVIVLSSSCIVSVWGVWVLLLQFHKHWND